jgi:hypothetical protein
MDMFALSIFYFLKGIGNNDFVGGMTPLPIRTPSLLFIFIPILYAISNRLNVGIKPNAIYAADSNISMVLRLIPSNIKYTQYNVEQIKGFLDLSASILVLINLQLPYLLAIQYLEFLLFITLLLWTVNVGYLGFKAVLLMRRWDAIH